MILLKGINFSLNTEVFALFTQKGMGEKNDRIL